jgi:sugar/nucleoside kinase (ribokinase family)
MIVIVGSPIVQRRGVRLEAGGRVARIARAAAEAGARVQVVGKVGDDEAGDAVLISLARAHIEHAAVLRDAAHLTPRVQVPPDTEADADVEELVLAEPDEVAADAPVEPDGLPLEAADIALALRYLTDFGVVVLAVPLDPATREAAVEAASFAGAHVVALDGDPSSDDSATTLSAPAGSEPMFDALVGRYAAAIDGGQAPEEAFRTTTEQGGWARSRGD